MCHGKYLIQISVAAICLSVQAAAIGGEVVFDPNTKTVSNWTSEAIENVRIKGRDGKERAVTDQDFANNSGRLRCMKMNNYWCVKAFGWKWEGQLGVDGAKHAAFDSAKMSARAAARDLRTKYVKHGYKSAYAIMSQYAPPDNCIGDVFNPDGSCRHGKNQTEEYARWIVRGITEDIRADINLFDSSGQPTNNLRVVLKNMSGVEVGPFFASDDIINAGIKLESNR